MRISERQGQIFLFGLAFLLRLIYLLEIRDHPLFHAPVIDAFYHLTEARRIVAGDFLAGAAPFWKPPFYSYVLALWLGLRVDLLGVRLVQVVMGALSAVLIYRLGVRTLGRPAAWIGGIGFAAYGPAIFFDGELLTPSLIVFLNLVLLLLLVGESLSGKRILLAGAVLGISGITRPDVLLFGAVAVPAILMRPAPLLRRVLLSGILVLTAAIPLGAVALRNYAVSGESVLVSGNGGANFYIGNHPAYVQSSGMWSAPGARLDASLKAAGVTSTSEADAFYYRRAFADIRDHPSAWLRVLLEKARLLANGYEISNNRDLYRERESSRLLSVLLWRDGLAFPFGIVLPFALSGILLALRRWRVHLLLIGFVVVYSVAIILFFVTARYRIPLVPVLLLFAGYGAHALTDACRGGRWKETVGLGTIVILGLPLANSSPGSTGHLPPTTEEHLAIVALGTGRPDEAKWLLEKVIRERTRSPRERLRLATAHEANGNVDGALETLGAIEAIPGIDPDWRATAHATMGRLLARHGRLEEAIPHWRRVAEIDPDSSYHGGRAYFHLGIGHFMRRQSSIEVGKIYETLGRPGDAADEYRIQISREPRDAEILGRLALVDIAMRECAEAVEIMERYLSLRPDDGSGFALLGEAHQGLGNIDAAEEAYRKCLEIYPQYVKAYVNLARLYCEAGRPDEAVEVLDSLLTIDPGNDVARNLRAQLRDR